MQALRHLWDNLLLYLGLGGVGLSALLGAAWFFGLLPVIGAAARVFASIVEALTPLFQAFVQGLLWVWQNVFWPGLKDIFDSLATILTVATLVIGAFLYTSANDAIRLNHAHKELTQCFNTLQRYKKPLPKPSPKPALWELRWPWE